MGAQYLSVKKNQIKIANFSTFSLSGKKKDMKEIKKKNLNKWEDILCSRTGRLDIVKMSVLPSMIYRLKIIPINIPARLLWTWTSLFLNFVWKDRTEKLKLFWKGRIKWEGSLYSMLSLTL